LSLFTPRTVLVTGGAGFIGSNFVRHLLGRDAQVRIVNLDLLTYAGSRENLVDLPSPERHTFVHGDICDVELVRTLLRTYRIDTIVHFAAESHVDRSIAGPKVFVHTNVNGTFSLLEEARQFWLEEQRWETGACRFHHISTDEVYGTLGPDDPPCSETTACAPNSPYAASKAGSEHLVLAYHHTFGLPTTITNCSNNYGPYQHSEKFIPTIIRSCVEHRPVPVYGNGSNIRDCLYVSDHCSAIDTVIRQGRIGETYNVGGGNNWHNLDVVRSVCQSLSRLSGKPTEQFTGLITFVKDRPGHDWRYALDLTKIQRELGWSPSEIFETGIHETVQWYLPLMASHSQQATRSLDGEEKATGRDDRLR